MVLISFVAFYRTTKGLEMNIHQTIKLHKVWIFHFTNKRKKPQNNYASSMFPHQGDLVLRILLAVREDLGFSRGEKDGVADFKSL